MVGLGALSLKKWSLPPSQPFRKSSKLRQQFNTLGPSIQALQHHVSTCIHARRVHAGRHKCMHACMHDIKSHCTTLRYITLHYITLRYIALHDITSHYTTLPYTTLHYNTLHHITLQYITSHYITLHYTTLHYTTLYYMNYIPMHYTTLHNITGHYTTLHCVTIHYITLGGGRVRNSESEISGMSPRTGRVESEKVAPESENMAIRVRKHTADFREMAWRVEKGRGRVQSRNPWARNLKP